MKIAILFLIALFLSSCTALPLKEDSKKAFREEFTTINKRLAGKLWKGKYERNLSTLTSDDYLIQLRAELLGGEETLKLVLDEGNPRVALKGVNRDFYVCLRSVKADVYSCDQAIPYGVEIQSVSQQKSLSEALLEFVDSK
ncbi:hypothetical protein [Halobacteriovorax sp. HLS]|uniref:hypothetical protein n=1 Tax=Halobacteriovorax sp. HLS TaxID=2234000 RepID=UPI000FDC0924|nr:hypothetical protein [Halobacteriovorax sp. HLS]